MQLRPDQKELSEKIDKCWDDEQHVVMAVAPTGFGKTVLFSHKILEAGLPSVAIAHRQELVAQMSLTLGKHGVEHRVICADKTRQVIERLHMKYLGRRWINTRAPHAAAGVHTLVRVPENDAYLRSVRFWVGDEGHHYLADNMWGRAVSRIGPDSAIEPARGLLVTATPGRADGQGLGRHADGLAHAMVMGPDLRHVIDAGNLTDYRFYAPPLTRPINFDAIKIGSTGEFQQESAATETKKSSIVGDVVASYLRIAPGLRGITFAVDIEHARLLTAEYKAKGVPAAIITGDMDTVYRARLMAQFAEGELLQLVNVDVLGEGTDVPACSVVSFARPTASFSLYAQQFGRSLRLMVSEDLMKRWGTLTPAERKAAIAQSAKPVAHVIDHVRNWERHRMPDSPRYWTLDRRDKRAKSKNPDDAVPLRSCIVPDPYTEIPCPAVYERTETKCPTCGKAPIIAARGRPEFVDGDIYELDPDVLAKLRGERDRIMDAPNPPPNLTGIARQGAFKQHRERKEAQVDLADAIDLWGGWQMAQGFSDREAYKRFYFAFGVDVMTARTLGRGDAETLAAKVRDVLHSNLVVNIHNVSN